MTGNAPLLEIRDLRTWFPVRRGLLNRLVGHVKAVDGVSLHVMGGETLGLVGESGCGKTTLGRSIAGLERPRSGQILFQGTDMKVLSRAERKRAARHLQMIFQDPAASLNPRLTVLDALTEGLQEHGLLEGSREAEGARLLAEVGLPPEALYRYPFEFSGGQRQRISLARAISLRPALVVCDEPVSSLDVSVQAQVINLLMDLREKHRLSYLFISHDLSVVRHLSDRIAVMYLGRIVEEGPAETVMGSPLHPYTQALLAAVLAPGQPRGRKLVLPGEPPSPLNPPSGCPFHARCPKAMDQCRLDYPPASATETRRVHCHLYPPRVPDPAPLLAP
ncbi:MAG TPA: ABC transporter ATP-binding protein [Kiritimatiellia bacterium]|nr:ABC transporter ATP-binding protein [Kiritimatiellia bacterium]HRZ12058.1 ABC transporter ATP-binding protein [Kiritimatiellia bacterium]HSA19611.1 ABC transporter ATP-binding protein [Kiritimatiellia bacterium]